MTVEAYPEQVQLLEAQGELHIHWDDGHVSPFTLAYIRGWCPCAMCQGHFTDTLKYQHVANPKLVNAEPVGNYGMKLTWADGHDTGIYSFDELRRSCICEVCDPTQARIKERERPRTL